MLKHFSEIHDGEPQESVKFGMTVVKQHFSSFSRQIHEWVLIQRDQNILNVKGAKYDRCVVPTLAAMVEEKTVQQNNVPPVSDQDTSASDLNKRKRTESVGDRRVSASMKRSRLVSRRLDNVSSEVVTCDTAQGSSNNNKTKHFLSSTSSNKVSNLEAEVKHNVKPKKVAGGNKSSAKSNGKENSILGYFKPVPGAPSAADKQFLPPD